MKYCAAISQHCVNLARSLNIKQKSTVSVICCSSLISMQWVRPRFRTTLRSEGELHTLFQFA